MAGRSGYDDAAAAPTRGTDVLILDMVGYDGNALGSQQLKEVFGVIMDPKE